MVERPPVDVLGRGREVAAVGHELALEVVRRVARAQHARARAPAGQAASKNAWAGLPHNRNVGGAARLASTRTISEVSACQPQFMCAPAAPTSTVSTGLSISTPWRAQPSSSQRSGGCQPGRSALRISKMRRSDTGLPWPAENASPSAWPGPRIGILAEHDHLDVVGRQQAQRAERIGRRDLAVGRDRLDRGGDRLLGRGRPARQHRAPGRRQVRERGRQVVGAAHLRHAARARRHRRTAGRTGRSWPGRAEQAPRARRPGRRRA